MNFFWVSTESHKKLDIGILKALNFVLVAKWLWRYKVKKGALWRNVIAALYGDNGNMGWDNDARVISGVWGKIATIYQDMERYNSPLNSLFFKALRNGANNCFWTDLWCNSKPLEILFQSLGALESNRVCSVTDRLMASYHDTGFNWN